MISVEGTSATAEADLSVYSLPALKKAAYRLADRCTVMFGTPNGSRIPLEFLFSKATAEDDARECVRAFFEEALDYDLRDRLAAETTPLRNLILAHAFSRTKLIQTND